MCRLGKRELVMAIVASLLWVNVSGATNRIYGIVVKHGSLFVSLFLRGAPPQGNTDAFVTLNITVEHNCVNPKQKDIDPGNPEFQQITLSRHTTVPSSAFEGVSFVEVGFNFTDELENIQCHQKNFIRVGGTSLVVAISGTAEWTNKNGRVIERQEIVSCDGALRGCGEFDEESVAFTGQCFPTQGDGTCADGLEFGCVQSVELTCMCATHDSEEPVDCSENIVIEN